MTDRHPVAAQRQPGLSEVAAVRRATEVELFSLAGHDGHLREVNVAFAQLLGLDVAEVDGRSLLELVHPEDIPAIVAGLSSLEGGAPEVLLENRFLQRDGGTVHLQWVARTVPGTDLWWAAGRDTTGFHRLLAQQGDMRARLDLALGQATAAMWNLEVRRGLLTWEAEAAEVLGVSAGEVPPDAVGLAAVAHPDDAAAVLAALQQLAGSGTAEVAFRVGPDGGLRHLSLRGKVLDRDRRGRPLRAVGLILDVTAEKAMEEQMLRMVMSDALTGVGNRRAFDQALRGEWRRCVRGLLPISVVMIDLDNFKQFNDTYGHLVGDAALCAVARALSAALHRPGDVLARFGGEEFAVVLPEVDEAGALAVAGYVVEAVRAVTLRQAPGSPLSVSVGTASWAPADTDTKAAELLARADLALYAAKAAGKDQALAYRDPQPAATPGSPPLTRPQAALSP